MAKNIEVTLTLDTKGYNKKLQKAKNSTAAFGGSANVTKGSVIGLAARFAPLAAAVVGVGAAFKGVSSAMSTAQGFQDVQVTLTNLIGSAEGGAAALEMIRDVAKDLPIEFEELAKSAPALTTVSGTIGELEENMLLAADIAANFGIPFEQAAGQLQRSFSAGAGAADVFREKGVLAAAGFQAGVSVSIGETQEKLREFGESIKGSAQLLNQTLTGALSQTSDRFTTFQDSVGQAMLPEFQVFLQELVKVFDQNEESIKAFGASIGSGVVNAFKLLLTSGAVVVDFLTMLFNTFRGLAQFIQDKFGNVIGTVMDFAVRAIAGVVETVGFLGKQLGKIVAFASGDDSMQKYFENIQNAANKARTGGIEMLKESLDDMSEVMPVTTAQDFVAGFIATIEAGAEKIEEKNKRLGGAGKDTIVEVAQSTLLTVEKFADSFGALSDGVLNTIKTFESATTKLSDDLATALTEGQGAGDAFKNYFKTLVKDIIAQAIRLAIIQPILSSIFGVQFGAGGSITGFSGGLFGKANGGPVQKNRPYLIGEQGPEVFTPSTSGMITPNDELGGGGGTTIINNITAMDTQSVKQALAKQDPEFIFGLSQAGARRVPG